MRAPGLSVGAQPELQAAAFRKGRGLAGAPGGPDKLQVRPEPSSKDRDSDGGRWVLRTRGTRGAGQGQATGDLKSKRRGQEPTFLSTGQARSP